MRRVRYQVAMSLDDHLQPGEQILYQAHTSLMPLVPPLFLAAVAGIAGLVAWRRFDQGWALVLGGVVASTLFSALVSLLVYIADPETRLPGIVFWLMGSFASADYAKCLIVAAAVGLGCLSTQYQIEARACVFSMASTSAGHRAFCAIRECNLRCTL